MARNIAKILFNYLIFAVIDIDMSQKQIIDSLNAEFIEFDKEKQQNT